jgi:hypothetical protein
LVAISLTGALVKFLTLLPVREYWGCPSRFPSWFGNARVSLGFWASVREFGTRPNRGITPFSRFLSTAGSLSRWCLSVRIGSRTDSGVCLGIGCTDDRFCYSSNNLRSSSESDSVVFWMVGSRPNSTRVPYPFLRGCGFSPRRLRLYSGRSSAVARYCRPSAGLRR